MKKIFFTIAVISTFGACNNKNDSAANNPNLAPLDSSHEYRNNVMSDTPQNVKSVSPTKDSAITTTTVTVTKVPVEPKTTMVHNSKTGVVKSNAPVNSNTNANSDTKGSVNATAGTANTNTAAPPAEPQKKKGLSNSAKGAIIGAGAGGVTGGVVGKNVKGAIIGSAIGAAGGYIIGRAKDKKEGRVKKDSL